MVSEDLSFQTPSNGDFGYSLTAEAISEVGRQLEAAEARLEEAMSSLAQQVAVQVSQRLAEQLRSRAEKGAANQTLSNARHCLLNLHNTATPTYADISSCPQVPSLSKQSGIGESTPNNTCCLPGMSENEKYTTVCF